MTRFGFVMTTYFSTLAVGVASFCHPSPRLIWNASPSVPVGLYAVRPAAPLFDGELVVAEPPKRLAAFFARRGYLPVGVPLLKHVATVPGDVVCRDGRWITVDGKVAAEALDRDRKGRMLPHWTGCRTLKPGEVFLLNPDAPDSLDGRYFGPLPATSIIGRATPIWTRSGR
jgi:conjugative transfer signal peptidase TraF